MKKFLSLFAFIALGFSAEVQAQSSIAAARTQATGTVTVRGIVTNGAELGPIRYLQDNVAGIAAYSPSLNRSGRCGRHCSVRAGPQIDLPMVWGRMPVICGLRKPI